MPHNTPVETSTGVFLCDSHFMMAGFGSKTRHSQTTLGGLSLNIRVIRKTYLVRAVLLPFSSAAVTWDAPLSDDSERRRRPLPPFDLLARRVRVSPAYLRRVLSGAVACSLPLALRLRSAGVNLNTIGNGSDWLPANPNDFHTPSPVRERAVLVATDAATI